MTDDRELPIKAQAALDVLRTQPEDSELRLRASRWQELAERLDLSKRELPEVLNTPAESWYVRTGKRDGRERSSGLLHSSLRGWGSYAAIAVFLVAVAGIKYMPAFNFLSRPSLVTHTYSTTTSQRAKLNLPDGSSVLLAPESKISYTSSFGAENRIVTLHGQALFTVVKDGHPPFVVNASGVSTRVLGTTFDVRAYDKNVRIAVAEGKVSVASQTLSIGDVAMVTGNSANVQRNTNITDLLSWTTGRLVFRDTPLSDVLADFHRTYGVNIQLANPGAGTRLVTVSISDMSPSGATEMLAGILGLRTEKRGGVTILTE